MQRRIVFTPDPGDLAERLRQAAALYQWLAPLLKEAATAIDGRLPEASSGRKR
jgi:hypothetical protein